MGAARSLRIVLPFLVGLVIPTAGAVAQSVHVLGGDVVLAPPTSMDFLAGYSVSGTMRVRVNARKNESWRLELRAASADMGGAGKPTSDVLWRTESSAWLPLTLSSVPVVQGQGKAFVTLHFRVRLQWDSDPAGSYSAPIELTLTPA